MKLLTLGATGGIGLEIVRQAIDAGHQVTHLSARRAAQEFAGRMAVMQGDVLNSADLERRLKVKTQSCQVRCSEPRSKADAISYGASRPR